MKNDLEPLSLLIQRLQWIYIVVIQVRRNRFENLQDNTVIKASNVNCTHVVHNENESNIYNNNNPKPKPFSKPMRLYNLMLVLLLLLLLLLFNGYALYNNQRCEWPIISEKVGGIIFRNRAKIDGGNFLKLNEVEGPKSKN